MAQTLSLTYNSQINLTSAADDPTTVTASGFLMQGILGSTFTAWNVTNAGTIQADNNAIAFLSGGTVSNEAGAKISGTGGAGIIINASAGSVTNAGTIEGNTSDNVGVVLNAGGSVTNEASGTISGYYGVFGSAAPATVVNSGVITGAMTASGINAGRGVYFDVGGSVTNQAGGTISGYRAVDGSTGVLTVVNAGVIAGNATAADGQGVFLAGGGGLTNLASGTISGQTAVYAFGEPATVVNAGVIAGAATPGGAGVILESGGTVVNSGTISGGDYAVLFGADSPNRLVLGAGAAFVGTVQGGNTIGAGLISTLELTSSASAGTLSGLGTQFINFAHTTIDLGANWILTGTNSIAAPGMITNLGTFTLDNASLTGGASLLNNGLVILNPSSLAIGDLTGTGTIEINAGSTLSVGGTVAATETIDFLSTSGTIALGTPTGFAGLIGGFGDGRFIDLPDVMVAQSGSILAGNTLEIVTAGGGVLDFFLDPTEDFRFQTVIVNADKITLSAPCFREGTLILTTRGEVPVEGLREGDRVITAGGTEPGEQPVQWVGYRRVDCGSHPRPDMVWPICVKQGAFAPNVPKRDLWLSPDHAVFVDEVLIPVKHLVNGKTITQHETDGVTYYHVELPRHDVVLANGLPSESYLGMGDRTNFENDENVLRLHPDFSMHRWEAEGFAPLQIVGPIVDGVRARLLARAQRLARSGSAARPVTLRAQGRVRA